MEDKWLTYAKRLHALATCGLEFTDSHYEQDRYGDIQSLANEMLNDLTQSSPEAIKGLMTHGIDGYVTPKVDVRAAVIRGNTILLVQEKTDQKWALPGGYADVGISPAENAVKEVSEEAGICVKATKLYGIRHKAKGEYKPDVRDFYKVFFLCEQEDTKDVEAGSEVMDARFFALDALPELSSGRTIKSDLEAAFTYLDNTQKSAFFDGADFSFTEK